MTRHTSFLIIVLLSVSSVAAQEFTPSVRWLGDLRVRSEVDMRDFQWRTAANTYTLLRARVAVEAMPVENVRVLVQMRDSRVFGQERDVTGAFSTLADTRNLDLHQGYVEVKKLFADELSLRIGRMELNYANERMIGAVGWHNVGRSFDGGVVRWELEPVWVDFLAMNTGEVQPYTPIATPAAVRYVRDVGQDFYGAYLSLKQVADHKIDGYVLYQSNRDTTPVTGKPLLSRFTLGSYLKGKANQIDYEAEVAFQGGKRQGIDVSAYLLTGAVGYSFEQSTLSRLAAGFELLSGTEAGATKFKTFDPLYPTAHKFHGFMDYFISIPANTWNRGLMNALVRATVAPANDVTANLWLHHFSLHQSDAGQKVLGQEIDGTVLYRHSKNLSFELGASAFIPGPVMRNRFGGSDVAVWGYLTTMVMF